MTTHILLVSEQAAANLLPTLDPDLKPSEAVLVVSTKMQRRADDLEAVLREAGVRVEREPLENEHDYDKLENTLLEIADKRTGKDIVLNVTGGTKLMALAAQAIAHTADWSVFYVDVDTDEVIWLGRQTRRQPLTSHLRLSHYLRGYGFTLPDNSHHATHNPLHTDLLRTLISQVGSLEKPLAQLNWLAQKAEEEKSLHVAMAPSQTDSRGLDALLRNFQEIGVLTVQGNMIHFANEEERNFAKGGWLEHYVYQTVGALSRDIGLRDKAANLVTLDRGGVKNELDVAFMARNRLFVIECKTARMDRPEAPKANDALFKLSENCRRIGGLGTRGMLASYRKLRDAEKRLAHAIGIEVVSGAELVQLDNRIRNWVRPVAPTRPS